MQEGHEAGAAKVDHAGDDGLPDAARLDQVGEPDRLDGVGLVYGADVEECHVLLVDAGAGELQGRGELVDDAAAGEVAKRVARIGQLGVDDGEGRRGIPGLEAVMVGDYHVDAERRGALHLGVVGDPAVDGDNESAALGREGLHRGYREAVGFLGDRYAPGGLDAELGQGLDHEDGRRDSVGVAVAEDEDLLALVGREEHAVDRVLHLREEEGVAEVAGIVLEEEKELRRVRDASAREYRGREEVEAVAARQLLHRLGRYVFLVPIHSAAFILR